MSNFTSEQLQEIQQMIGAADKNEGQKTYEAMVNPRKWEVNNMLDSYGNPLLTEYTPTWTASTNPSIGNGALLGYYYNIGKLVIYWGLIKFGSTTNAGSGTWNISVPIKAEEQAYQTGNALILDNGTNYRTGVTYFIDNSNIGCIIDSTNVPVKAGTPITWTTNDYLRWTVVYHAERHQTKGT